MGFLQSFLRSHFVEKSVIALQNVGCFLSNADSAHSQFQTKEGQKPFGAAHTYITLTRQYLPPSLLPPRFQLRKCTQQSFIRGGSAPRSNPLPFYKEKVTFRIPSVDTLYHFAPLLNAVNAPTPNHK